jgi:hypothetical protein
MKICTSGHWFKLQASRPSRCTEHISSLISVTFLMTCTEQGSGGGDPTPVKDDVRSLRPSSTKALA